MSTGRKIAGSLCQAAGAILLLCVVALCVPFAVPPVFGYQPYAIVSGSMEPAIPTGSVVYTHSVNPEEVEPGEVITFFGELDGMPVTHRVVENNTADRQFVTRGDANADNDVTPVDYTRLIGRVVRSIPYMGILLPLFSDMSGKVYLLVLIIAGVLLRIVGSRLREEDDEDEDE